MSSPYFRLIGDVHQKLAQYIKLANEAEYSLQLGDLGFRYNPINALDSTRHRVLSGNHDNYTEENGIFINQTPHFLGDYGIHTVPEFGDIFFVRGGNSIDKNSRTEWVDWFRREELSYAEGTKALELYCEIKPKFMVSHECPANIMDYFCPPKTWDGELLKPSNTAKLLQAMFNYHKPDLHIFGHHHRRWDDTIDGCRFVCLEELGVLDLERNTNAGKEILVDPNREEN
jgi:predicted phosphodiesterase